MKGLSSSGVSCHQAGDLQTCMMRQAPWTVPYGHALADEPRLRRPPPDAARQTRQTGSPSCGGTGGSECCLQASVVLASRMCLFSRLLLHAQRLMSCAIGRLSSPTSPSLRRDAGTANLRRRALLSRNAARRQSAEARHRPAAHAGRGRHLPVASGKKALEVGVEGAHTTKAARRPTHKQRR